MLHRFEIHSPLELPRTALLCCRLAASRLRETARWQKRIYPDLGSSSDWLKQNFPRDQSEALPRPG